MSKISSWTLTSAHTLMFTRRRRPWRDVRPHCSQIQMDGNHAVREFKALQWLWGSSGLTEAGLDIVANFLTVFNSGVRVSDSNFPSVTSSIRTVSILFRLSITTLPSLCFYAQLFWPALRRPPFVTPGKEMSAIISLKWPVDLNFCWHILQCAVLDRGYQAYTNLTIKYRSSHRGILFSDEVLLPYPDGKDGKLCDTMKKLFIETVVRHVFR